MADTATHEQPASSDTEDAAAHLAPPGLPEIQDEAADTPRWVPLLGLGILVALIAVFAFFLFKSPPAGGTDANGAQAAPAGAAAGQ